MDTTVFDADWEPPTCGRHHRTYRACPRACPEVGDYLATAFTQAHAFDPGPPEPPPASELEAEPEERRVPPPPVQLTIA